VRVFSSEAGKKVNLCEEGSGGVDDIIQSRKEEGVVS
jgi:hypothetical protein